MAEPTSSALVTSSGGAASSSSSSPSPAAGDKVKGERIANCLEGYGRNVARFRIAGSAERCQVSAYFWCPEFDRAGNGEETVFSVAAFIGSYLPDSEDLSSWASFISITAEELTTGVWLKWSIDRTDDLCLIFDATIGDSDSRYFFNGLLIDEANADISSPDQQRAAFLAKDSQAPRGTCGGVYVGPWDQDYILPSQPSSPEGAPRLVGYHLNAGKSVRVRRHHYSGFSKDPRGLLKLPSWRDNDPTQIQLDELELSRVRQVFEKFDHDHNNFIDRKEMTKVAEHVYELFRNQAITQDQVDDMFNKYDKNKDSQLSLSEFEIIFLHIKKDLIAQNLLQKYPKHYQWRANSHVPHISSIKIAGSPQEDPSAEAQYYSYNYNADPSVWQMFNPAYYAHPGIAYYSDSSSSSSDSDEELFYHLVAQEQQQQQQQYHQHLYHQQLAAAAAAAQQHHGHHGHHDYQGHHHHHQQHPAGGPHHPHCHDRSQQYSTPPEATNTHDLLFPELPALRDLTFLKHELPMNDYFEVQAGFLRFLKLRLGFTDVPVPTTAAATSRAQYENLYNYQNPYYLQTVYQPVYQPIYCPVTSDHHDHSLQLQAAQLQAAQVQAAQLQAAQVQAAQVEAAQVQAAQVQAAQVAAAVAAAQPAALAPAESYFGSSFVGQYYPYCWPETTAADHLPVPDDIGEPAEQDAAETPNTPVVEVPDADIPSEATSSSQNE